VSALKQPMRGPFGMLGLVHGRGSARTDVNPWNV
jgi:hypothetical protein